MYGNDLFTSDNNMGMNEHIDGGAFQVARKIFDSDLWLNKPSTWKIIWLYIVGNVNHTPNEKFDRGEGFFNFTKELRCIGNDITADMVKKFCVYARDHDMIRTTKSTRGMTIKVLSYDKYQSLSSYQSTTPSTKEAREKHERSTTINKNGKNERMKKNNILSPDGDGQDKIFSFKEQIKKMGEDKDKRMVIIAYYWFIKGFKFPTRQAYETALRRELRAAGSIVGYENDQIKATIAWLKENADFKWTLETVHKYIDEPLENLAKGGKPKTEEDEINELRKKYANN